LKHLFNGEPLLMSSLYSCHLEFFHSREVDSREAFCIAADCASTALPRSRGLAGWLVRRHSQSREAIAEPAAFEETLQPAATLRRGHDE
jgi:hypothetical protein